MYWDEGANAVTTLPTSPAGSGVEKYFEDSEAPGTVVTAAWANGITQELLNVLGAVDIAPSNTTYNQVVTAITAMIVAALASYTPPASTVLWLRNQQTSGTGGGETLSEGWNQRVLNTVVDNTVSGASLSDEQFTLPAGTYEIFAQSQAELTTDGVLTHRLRLRDTTAGATLIAGVNGQAFQSADLPVLTAVLQGRFTLAASHVLELDSWVEAAATAGAYTSTGEVEVFTDVYIRKIA